MMWRRLAGLGVIVAIISGAYIAGVSAGKNSTALRHEKHLNEVAARMTKTIQQYREKERDWSKKAQALSDALADAQANARSEFADTIDSLRDGNLRLREQFQACRDRVPETSVPSGGHDDAGGGGLSITDQAVALRIGADADAVVNRLTACQRYVMSLLK